MHPLMDRGLLRIEGMSIFTYYQYATNVLLFASPLASRRPERGFIYAFSRRLGVLLMSFLSGTPALDTLCVCVPLQAHRLIVRSAPLRWLLWLVRRAAVLATEAVARARVVRSDEFSMASALIERWRTAANPGDLSWRGHMAVELGTPGDWSRELSPFYRLVCFLESVLGLAGGADATIPELCVQHGEGEGRAGMAPSRDYGDQDFFIVPLLANVFCTGCIRRPAHWLDEQTAYADLERFLRMGWDTLGAAHPAEQASLGRLLEITTLGALPLPPVTRSVMAMVHLPDPAAPLGPPAWSETVRRLLLHTLARQRRMLPAVLQCRQGLDAPATRAPSGALVLAIWYVVLGFALELYHDGTEDGRELAEAHWIIAGLCQAGDGFFAELHGVAAGLRRQPHARTTVCSIYDDHRMARRWAPVLSFLGPDALDQLGLALHHQSRSSAGHEAAPGTRTVLTNAQCYAAYLPSLLRTARSLVPD